MTVILETDATQRALLQAMLHGSTGVGSVEDLSSNIQDNPHEFAVVIGPSITTQDATAFAQWARVNRPDLGVILLRDTVDANALSLALRSGMREVVQSKDLAGITTAVQRARSVASAIGQKSISPGWSMRPLAVAGRAMAMAFAGSSFGSCSSDSGRSPCSSRKVFVHCPASCRR